MLLKGGYCAQIKYILSYLLTWKLDIRKTKGEWKKQVVAIAIPKIFSNARTKRCFKKLL